MTAAWASTATSITPSTTPTDYVTIGKVDTKTGEVKYLKVDRSERPRRTAHGLVRDGDGNFWFDINPGRRSLGKLDVKTEKITVYQTPTNMSPLGGAVTMDVDGKGKVWASAPDGVLRFDPATEKFTDFKSTRRSRTRRAPTAPMAPRATATATAGGRRWRSTPSARPT